MGKMLAIGFIGILAFGLVGLNGMAKYKIADNGERIHRIVELYESQPARVETEMDKAVSGCMVAAAGGPLPAYLVDFTRRTNRQAFRFALANDIDGADDPRAQAFIQRMTRQIAGESARIARRLAHENDDVRARAGKVLDTMNDDGMWLFRCSALKASKTLV